MINYGGVNMHEQKELSDSVIIFEAALTSREPVKELLKMAADYIRKDEMENLNDIDVMLIDRFIEFLRQGTGDDLNDFQAAILSFTDNEMGQQLKLNEAGKRFFHRWDHFHDLCDAAIENYDPQQTKRFIESKKRGKELMQLLFENPEGIRHNELSSKLGISPQNLSKLIREFQEHQLISKERNNKVSIIKPGITGRAYLRDIHPGKNEDPHDYRFTPEPLSFVAEKSRTYKTINPKDLPPRSYFFPRLCA
jgi:CRP-like cAMP-binding protein